MPASSTLSYIDNVISTYDAGNDKAAYDQVQVNTKTTTSQLEVSSDSDFQGEVKVGSAGAGTNNYKLPNPTTLPADRNLVNYYVAVDDSTGTDGELVFKSFADAGTRLDNIEGISISGTPRSGSLVYFESSTDISGNLVKTLVVDESNEYNTFNAKEEIIASDLSMLDYVLVSANKEGSGLGLYRLTLGNLVQSVQILASEISTIGSLTSNTKATAGFNSIDFTVEETAYNPKMIFDIKGLTLKSGSVIVPATNSFSLGQEITISGTDYYDGSMSVVSMQDINENDHEYEGFNFQRVNFGDSSIKNLSLYFEGDQEVVLNNANTRIGQNLSLLNSSIDFENSSLTLSNVSAVIDQGLGTADDVNFNSATMSALNIDTGASRMAFGIGASGNAVFSSIGTTNAVEFDVETEFLQPVKLGTLTADTITADIVTFTNAATFDAAVVFNQAVYNDVQFNGRNGAKIVNSGVAELIYDSASTEDYELFVAGGDLQIGPNVGSPTVTIENDTGLIDAKSITSENNIQVGADLIIGGNVSVPTGEITAATVSATNLNQGGSAVTSSSLAYKENITSVNNGLDLIMNMKPVSYNRKTKTTEDREIGFIAEEMEKVLPTIVSPYKENKGIRYTEIIPVLVSALQEQQEKINELEKKLSK